MNLNTLLAKKLAVSVGFFIYAGLFFPCFSQVPSVIETIRIPVWAQVDVYPELQEAFNKDDATGYDYAISEIKKIAPFLVQGMVYGWNFEYTPKDSERNVEEYFELTEINPLGYEVYSIQYESPWIEDNKFSCWCSYSRNSFQVQTYYMWASIKNPKIQGRGYGQLSKGCEGIKDAAEEAVKDAVRDYYREILKNKPKEISGAVLIRYQPQLGVDAGRYMINLDFFLECGTIIEYTRY